jgi:uroporphyrin-III C-methyltransferase
MTERRRVLLVGAGPGDPELLTFKAARAGIDFEAIPGASSGIAAPAAAGIPVTHRGVASGVTFVSSHDADGAEPDWDALARSKTTLVISMGVAALAAMTRRMLDAGLAPGTPAAAIERATWHDQRIVRASLAGLADAAARARLKSPAIVVVGDCVAMANVISRARQGQWTEAAAARAA